MEVGDSGGGRTMIQAGRAGKGRRSGHGMVLKGWCKNRFARGRGRTR